MKYIHYSDIIELAVSKIGKPCVYVSYTPIETDEDIIVEKLSELVPNDIFMKIEEFLFDTGLIVCESEDEANRILDALDNDDVFELGIFAIAYDRNGNVLTNE